MLYTDWQFLQQGLPLIVTGLCSLFAFYGYKRFKRKCLPPGPIGIPFFGYVFFLGSNPGKTFTDLANKYGAMMTVTLGNDDWVILNDYDIIQEAFVKQGAVFSGRPSNDYIERFTKGGHGITFSDGEDWKKSRKFGNIALRGLGIGKRAMETVINDEARNLVDLLSTENGITLRSKIGMGTANIISGIAVGSRYEYTDKKFHNMIAILRKFFSDSYVGQVVGLAMFCPVIRFLPFFKTVIRGQLSRYEILLGIYRKKVGEHKSTYEENHLKDFIDYYLKEARQKHHSGVFFEENLVHSIRDLFDAGFGTTSTGLVWCILALAHFPDCEAKIFSEINDIIGRCGIPSMEHQGNMPYLCAFIQEVLRHRTIGPVGLARRTTSKTILGGYKLEKNTKVIANLWAVHHDSRYFPDPEVFKPERFIDAEGKFVKSKQVIPFSVGPRRCLGENLANMEIFLFLTNIVQKLKILPSSKPLPPFDNGVFNGVAYESFEFEIDFEKR